MGPAPGSPSPSSQKIRHLPRVERCAFPKPLCLRASDPVKERGPVRGSPAPAPNMWAPGRTGSVCLAGYDRQLQSHRHAVTSRLGERASKGPHHGPNSLWTPMLLTPTRGWQSARTRRMHRLRFCFRMSRSWHASGIESTVTRTRGRWLLRTDAAHHPAFPRVARLQYLLIGCMQAGSDAFPYLQILTGSAPA
jgi:hypothetical protein